MPTDETKAIDAAERVLSLESKNLDKDGAAESIKGLSDELLTNNRLSDVKGTDNFRIARCKAQVGKWGDAGYLWEKETTNPKMKIAGRASYNMAIINEINGNLEDALKWAQKSYENYNNKLGLKYVRILENRRYKNEVLKNQEGK